MEQLTEGKFEVKYKDRTNPKQIHLLKSAIFDLASNFRSYTIIKRKNQNSDQTAKFFNFFKLTTLDLYNFIMDYVLDCDVALCGDILVDRDRPDNLLYTVYIKNGKMGHFDSSKNREPYIYIKWNPKNKCILACHTMREEHERLYTYAEKLSFSQLKAEVVPDSKANNHLNYFYKQRNKLNGQGNRSIKFLTADFDDSDGSITFAFRTNSTYNNEPKKELENDYTDNGTLSKNISDEYILQLKICDFFDIFDSLIEVGDTKFSKEDIEAILELSEEVRIGCTCPSSYWMGGDYYLSQIDAQLKLCTIKPKFWNKPELRGETKVCKHLLSLLNHISFFLPQMAQATKSQLMGYGLL